MIHDIGTYDDIGHIIIVYAWLLHYSCFNNRYSRVAGRCYRCYVGRIRHKNVFNLRVTIFMND